MMASGVYPLPAGATIGILGGGQLGRMLAMAARRLGYRVAVLDPSADCPAAGVADSCIAANFDDTAAARALASASDVVTYEFENVPAAAVRAASEIVEVLPDARALEVAQNRLSEKAFAGEAGIAVAPYLPLLASRHAATIAAPEFTQDKSASQVAYPAILKTCSGGYDGHGQVRVERDSDLAAAWQQLEQRDAVLEQVVPFAFETSVVAARSRSGEMRAYALPENVHRGGILRTSTVPSRGSERLNNALRAATFRLMERLDYVGVMAAEFFVVADAPSGGDPGNGSGGDLEWYFNELAPRVHNSGHWTIEGAYCSQFEQHIRAVAGLPLGSCDTVTLKPQQQIVMRNLLGEEVYQREQWLKQPAAAVHIYGKGEARPGRKMGHVTYLEG